LFEWNRPRLEWLITAVFLEKDGVLIEKPSSENATVIPDEHFTINAIYIINHAEYDKLCERGRKGKL